MLTKYYDGFKEVKIDVPEKCPVTNLPFFMMVKHPDLGFVPTYGGPYDSYTIPKKDNDGNYYRTRVDHDEGNWIDGYEYVEVQEAYREEMEAS